ncbi:filamentous hemagglutinin N-terminal domain-containing protein [Massilia sp. W12]|uniref:two-partner secretion domain-containing protein n=1 Tax=Massilia sp. W12 TaxID=3126507 RepID=UPI0030CE4ABF
MPASVTHRAAPQFLIANLHRITPDHLYKRTLLASLLAASLSAAYANPQLPQVVYGQVNINQQGKVMQITNSPNAIIDWQSFSIAAGETTRFIQQSANSAVLNRVRGVDPSQIFGALQSNGRVFLLNPNGILFGPSAKVDVHSLVASSLPMANEDFLRGKWQFGDGKTHGGKVINAGQINSGAGGQVMLIAPQVENSGIITSQRGEVMLAAGHSVQLVDANNPDMHVVVSAPAHQALNLGEIVANAGKIGIYGALVKQQGRVLADSAQLDASGKVVFKSSRSTELGANSVTSVRSVGNGGTLMALGPQVDMQGAAMIDASGATGGGTVLLGGDFQGKNPQIPNAQQTTVAKDAQILAKAEQSGVGGRIIAWSDGSTNFQGMADASGVAQGGLVETSGKQHLFIGAGKVRATGAKAGVWLLDPSDITVRHGSTNSLSGGVFDPSAPSTIGDTEINAVLDGGTDVVLQTSSGTGGTGIIKIEGSASENGAVSIKNSSSGKRSLSLITSGDISLDYGASILGTDANALDVNFNTSGKITLAGQMNLANGKLTLSNDASLSGLIKNSTLSSSKLITGSNGTLQDVTLDGSAELGGSLFVAGNLNFADQAAIKQSGYLYFTDGATQTLDSSGNASLTLSGGTLVGGYQVSGQTIKLGSGLLLQGHGSVSESNGAALENHGSIIANDSGQALFINLSKIDNQGGLMKANTGGLMTLTTANWSNSGTLLVNSASTMNLNLQTSTSTLGGITNNGGTLNWSGVLDNSANTLELGTGGVFGAGGLSNLEGTIKGGEIKSGDGSKLHSGSGGYLDDVTIVGTLPISGSINVKNGLTLADGALLNVGAATLSMYGSGSFSISTPGQGEIRLGGGSFALGASATGQSVTLENGISLTGYGTSYDNAPSTLLNKGLISANHSGQNLTLFNKNLHNYGGTLQAAGGALTLQTGTYASTGGKFDVSSGQMILHTPLTTSDLNGAFSRSGGKVVLAGTLDNSSDTLDISSSGPFGTGGLDELSGTIQGGTVSSGSGHSLQSSGAMDGVTLAGELSMSGTLSIKNSLQLANGAKLNLGAGSLYFVSSGTQQLSSSGNAEVVLGGGTILAGYGVTAQQLQIDPGVTLSGHGVLGNSDKADILHSGTINANVSGETLLINPHSFANSGTLEVNDGTLTLQSTNWSNFGTLKLASGQLNLNLHTTTADLGSLTRSGGTVVLGGKLDNSGATLDTSASGPFGAGGLNHINGDISGGTISGDGKNTVQISGATFDGVTLAGTLNVSGSFGVKNDLQMDDGARLELGSATIGFLSGGAQLLGGSGNGEIVLGGGSLIAGYGVSGQTLQIGPNTKISGHGYITQSNAATVENYGHISADVSTHNLVLNPDTLINNGKISAAGGNLHLQAGSVSNSGTLDASDGKLQLSYNTTTAALGTIAHSGGVIHFDGELNNSGAELDIGGGGNFGALGLDSFSGLISGGTLKSGDGKAMPSQGGQLDGVNIAGKFTLGGNLLVKNLSLESGSVLELGSHALLFNGSGLQTLGSNGSAEVTLDGGYLQAGHGVNGQTLAISSGVRVYGHGDVTENFSATLQNQGVIEANASGKQLSISVTKLENSGTLKADGGALLINQTQWTNSGTLELNSGAMHLDIDTTTAGLGAITHTDGKLVYVGTLDNSGATLDIGAHGHFGAKGLTQLDGKIKNGNVQSSGGIALSGSNGRLDGVQLTGDVKLDGYLLIDNGLSLADGVNLELNGASLYINGGGTQTISSSGNAQVHLQGGIVYAGGDQSGQTLQIGAGVTLRGQGSILQSQAATLQNKGEILADDNMLTISGLALDNQGTLKANGGTLFLQPSAWSNAGLLQISSGEAQLHVDAKTADLGNVSNSGGVVSFYGKLDNSSDTLSVGLSGKITTLYGEVKGGAIEAADSSVFDLQGATLDGVTITGELHSSGSAIIKNNLTLADQAHWKLGDSFLNFHGSGTQHIASAGNATLSGGKDLQNSGTNAHVVAGYGSAGQTLAIGKGITLRGGWYLEHSNNASILNAGVLHNEGASSYLQASDVQNSGTIKVSNGVLYLNGMSANAGAVEIGDGATLHAAAANISNTGLIRGSGELYLGSGTLSNAGQIQPGDASNAGTLKIDGHFTQNAGGALKIRVISDANQYDKLSVAGDLTLDGTLELETLGGYVPAKGDAYQFLSYQSKLNGDFATLAAPDFSGATLDKATAGQIWFKMPPASLINIWTFDGDGNWSDSSKWSLGHVPASDETVQLPDYSSQYTVTLDNGVNNVKSLVLLGNDKLAINGGSLTLNQNSSANLGGWLGLGGGLLSSLGDLDLSFLNLSNGALDIASGKLLTVAHYSQSGGTLSGPGMVKVTDSWLRSSGVLNSLGGLSITQQSGALTPGSISGNMPLHLQTMAGDIQISSPISINGARVKLQAGGGAITGAAQISAPELVLQAAHGIGDPDNLMNLAVDKLQAAGGENGGIFIKNAGNLKIVDMESRGLAIQADGASGPNWDSKSLVLDVSGFDVQIDGKVMGKDQMLLKAANLDFANHANAVLHTSNGDIKIAAGKLNLPAAATISQGAGVNMQLQLDHLDLQGTIDSGTQSWLTIAPLSSNQSMLISNTHDNGKLSLLPADFSHIQSKRLDLGDIDHALHVDASVSLPNSSLFLYGSHLSLGPSGALPYADVRMEGGKIDLSQATAASIGQSGGKVLMTADQIEANGFKAIVSGQSIVGFKSYNKATQIVSSISNNGELELLNADLAALQTDVLALDAYNKPLNFNAALDLRSSAGKLTLYGSCFGKTHCGEITQMSNAPIMVDELYLQGNTGLNLPAPNLIGKVSGTVSPGGSNFDPVPATHFIRNAQNLELLNLNMQQPFGLELSNGGKLNLSGTLAMNQQPLSLVADEMSFAGQVTNAAMIQLAPDSARPLTLGSSVCVQAPCLALDQLDHLHTEKLMLGKTGHLPSALALSSNTDTVLLPSELQYLWLRSSGAVTQSAKLNVTYLALQADGAVNLPLDNAVSHVAAAGAGDLSLKSISGLALGSAPAHADMSALSGIVRNGDIYLHSGGSLDVSSPLQALGGHQLRLQAGGAISNGSANLQAASLDLEANGGIQLLSNVNAVKAVNSGSGDIVLNNTGVLSVGDVTQNSSANIQIDNIGALTVNGKVSSTTGNISLVAHSPLTVNGSVISSNGGALLLEAGKSNSISDVLQINSGASVSSSGAVNLLAGDAIVVQSGASLSPQAVLNSYQNGGPPSVNDCMATPQRIGCSAILPDINTCTANPATLGCSVVLPSLNSCIVNPNAAGCSVVLPSMQTCQTNPSAPGCSVVLPNLDTCQATPSAPGCNVVLPNLATCMANPAAAGCSVVLPNLATCQAAPATPGCSVILPSLASCIANPATAGCSAVLPTMAACLSAPATPGCSVVLPNIDTCQANPSAPGCNVVLPNLDSCIANPAAPGCNVVLPNLASCMANPATPGCSVILPNLTSCIANPATAGCSVVLPNLAACIATPSLPGCSAVLPDMQNCMANPAAPGCNVVLPSLAACIASPSAPGCSAVLPGLEACLANPATPGCSVQLPSLASCISNPATMGCSAVLPTLSACISNPATPGCNVILPSLASCAANPATPGCSAVLPALTACMSNPALPGCSVVLPNLSACISNPATPGCSSVLPSLATCIVSPGAAGCSAVLPSLAECSANPSLPGCSAVVPQIDQCLSNPASCVSGGGTGGTNNSSSAEELRDALNNTVNLTSQQSKPATTVLASNLSKPEISNPSSNNGSAAANNSGSNNSGAAGGRTPPANDSASKPGDGKAAENKSGEQPADNKPADAKSGDSKSSDSKDEGSKKEESSKENKKEENKEVKKEEPARKLYCN